MAINRELPWVLAISYAGMFAARSYRGIWRFAALADGWRLWRATGAIAMLLLVASRFIALGIDFATGLVFLLLLFNLLVGTRLSLTILHRVVQVFAVSARRIVIVGAGLEG